MMGVDTQTIHSQIITSSPSYITPQTIFTYNQMIHHIHTQNDHSIPSPSSSMPSNELAKLLVEKSQNVISKNNSNNNLNLSILELLTVLKNKKNFNAESFSSHIETQLKKQNPQIFGLLSTLKVLSQKMIELSNPEGQIKSVAQGFKKYFINYFKNGVIAPKIRKDFIMKLIADYFSYDSSCSFVIADIILALSKKMTVDFSQIVEKKIYEDLIQFIKSRKICTKISKKCIAIIKTINLYHYFKTKDLVEIALRADIRDTIIFFTDFTNNLKKDLIQAYIIKQSSIDSKLVGKVIDQLKLNPMDYPALMKVLAKKSLRYFLSVEPIFSLDLKIKGRMDIIESLVEILIDQNRKKQALHFINKYQLKQYYYLNPTNDRSHDKNHLQAYDTFAPTQQFLCKYFPNKYPNKGYLELKKFGYEEHQVLFVDQSNLTQEVLDNIFLSPEFGLDCEDAPNFCAYDPKRTSTIQIAINYKKKTVQNQETKQSVLKFAYILDLFDLKNSQIFTSWFCNKLYATYKGKIVGHTVKEDFKGILQQILPQGHVANLQSLSFVDVKETFKNKYKEDKCSLQFICNRILGENLSKFEQCSGWQNRPLRKAQLHYAALDAVLPLILKKKLVDF